jgi:uncharacterized protein
MLRKQKSQIIQDLATKMVFLVGPRQVGKTWLAKDIAQNFNHPTYLNYDNLQHRKIIRDMAWLESTDFLIFDELHKMPDWKNYLKGVFDTKSEHLAILVTGSARLDLLRQVGDSLAGRFFTHRLLPFSLSELKGSAFENDIDRLLARGGFPEPFLAENLVDADRWRQLYIDSLMRTDIFDFEKVFDLRAIQLVLELLRTKVGSPVSYSSIAQDVGIAPNTVKKYIQIFEALYIVFRVTPFSKNIARSLLKEPKIYFFDTGLVVNNKDDGARLENMVAVSLLKHVYAKQDLSGENYNLQYIRTKDGQEIDFALIANNNIEQLVEVKQSDKNPSKALSLISKKYGLPAMQIIKNLRTEQKIGDINIRNLLNFLNGLLPS